MLCNQIRSEYVLCELSVGNISNYTVLITLFGKNKFVT